MAVIKSRLSSYLSFKHFLRLFSCFDLAFTNIDYISEVLIADNTINWPGFNFVLKFTIVPLAIANPLYKYRAKQPFSYLVGSGQVKEIVTKFIDTD